LVVVRQLDETLHSGNPVPLSTTCWNRRHSSIWSA